MNDKLTRSFFALACLLLIVLIILSAQPDITMCQRMSVEAGMLFETVYQDGYDVVLTRDELGVNMIVLDRDGRVITNGLVGVPSAPAG